MTNRGATSSAYRRLAVVAACFLALGCDLFGPREPQRWIAVDVGAAFTCALTPSGHAACWGAAADILECCPPSPPDEVMPNSAVPLLVPKGGPFISLTLENDNVCGIEPSGLARCWGANTTGSLGNGTVTAKRIPDSIVGGHRWRSVSGGGTHMCGITHSDDAYCWGNAWYGALGTGGGGGVPLVFVTAPTPVVGGHKFKQVVAGLASTCAITLSGQGYCWGAGNAGQLGTGTVTDAPVPTPSAVTGGLTFTSIASNTHHVCAVALDAKAYCWGSNWHGSLGTGDEVNRPAPTAVAGDLTWSQISTGAAHTCGIATAGATYCWGRNNRGQLGNGTFDSAFVPTPVAAPHTFIHVAAGGSRTCAIDASGLLYCWGFNERGQLGNGGTEHSAVPVLVSRPVF